MIYLDSSVLNPPQYQGTRRYKQLSNIHPDVESPHYPAYDYHEPDHSQGEHQCESIGTHIAPESLDLPAQYNLDSR